MASPPSAYLRRKNTPADARLTSEATAPRQFVR
jgi:hypothetical protein